jgi:hypothetical protein
MYGMAERVFLQLEKVRFRLMSTDKKTSLLSRLVAFTRK